MTGQEIYQLGKGSPAARACIPLNFSHTPPRIFFEGKWLAEFWYYVVDYNEEAVYEPQFYLLLELPGGSPVQMRRLSEENRCLGPAPEVVTEGYYQQLNGYLEACGALLQAESATEAQIQELLQKWLQVQPQVMGTWMSQQEFSTQAPPQRTPRAAESPAEDLVAYWKQEMAQAVKAGDAQRINETQQQLLKAMQRLRS